MREMVNNLDKLYLAWVLLFLSLAAAGFLLYENIMLEKKLTLETEQFEAKEADLEMEISALVSELKEVMIARDGFEQKYFEEKDKIVSLSSQIESIQGALGIIEKIQSTDKELLQKYSKVYFLNENYLPSNLVPINQEFLSQNSEPKLIHAGVWQNLINMLVSAKSQEIDILVLSAYRSFDEQSQLKSNYKFIYGDGANQFSADQGYSEHQLGTTVDLTTSSAGGVLDVFVDSRAYAWLLNNAHKFGFILSYPDGNSYYQFEPWHWRFVGKELAQKLYEEKINFYDLNQREIDSFLVNFFD